INNLTGYEPDRQDNRAAGSRRRSFAGFCGGDLMSALAEFSAPVDKRSLDRAAADKLRQAIVAGKIAPGARLKEANLALQFQLSRGTVRTALHRLVAEGLVAQRPYSGWQVVSLSSHDAWELYTLRGSLEALAARLAAANMNDTSRHKLWEAFGRLKTAVREKKRRSDYGCGFLNSQNDRRPGGAQATRRSIRARGTTDSALYRLVKRHAKATRTRASKS